MQNAPAPDGSLGAAAQLADLRHALRAGRPRAGDAGALGAYAADWPCMWGEEFTGAPLSAVGARGQPGRLALNLRPAQARWDRASCTACAVRPTTGGNLAFEAGVLATRPSCEVHIFAAARDGVANASTLVEEHHDGSSWFTPEQASRVHLHRATVSEVDDPAARPPKRTLAGLMRELGHAHVDVLKVDLGGLEWSLFARTSGARLEPLPSVGQLQLSAYTARATAAADYVRLFNYLEAAGLRLFAKEASLSQKGRVDLAFVQARWSPEGKLVRRGGGGGGEAARGGGGARGEAPPPEGAAGARSGSRRLVSNLFAYALLRLYPVVVFGRHVVVLVVGLGRTLRRKSRRQRVGLRCFDLLARLRQPAAAPRRARRGRQRGRCSRRVVR